MRTIKFRAWDKERNKMRYGCDNLLIGLDGCLFWNFGNNCVVIGGMGHHSEYTIMQYTGLIDRNGKEIYEGDIIFYNRKAGGTKKFIVIFERGGFCIQTALIGNCEKDSLEVIGNIYEHPELVEHQAANPAG